MRPMRSYIRWVLDNEISTGCSLPPAMSPTNSQSTSRKTLEKNTCQPRMEWVTSNHLSSWWGKLSPIRTKTWIGQINWIVSSSFGEKNTKVFWNHKDLGTAGMSTAHGRDSPENSLEQWQVELPTSGEMHPQRNRWWWWGLSKAAYFVATSAIFGGFCFLAGRAWLLQCWPPRTMWNEQQLYRYPPEN